MEEVALFNRIDSEVSFTVNIAEIVAVLVSRSSNPNRHSTNFTGVEILT